MSALLHLFGRSPFAPLEAHMERVRECVAMLKELFAALEKGEQAHVEAIAEQISKLEHKADLTKNDIRNHLPKTLFLPIDRSHLLEMLANLDSIADRAEDVAVLTTVKPLTLLPLFKEQFFAFLNANLETFQSACQIIKELHDLLESSFGSVETEKVRKMVDAVAYQEHNTDKIQRELLKQLILAEEEMSYTTFFLWQKICNAMAEISNLSENLANRVRTTLENK